MEARVAEALNNAVRKADEWVVLAQRVVMAKPTLDPDDGSLEDCVRMVLAGAAMHATRNWVLETAEKSVVETVRSLVTTDRQGCGGDGDDGMVVVGKGDEQENKVEAIFVEENTDAAAIASKVAAGDSDTLLTLLACPHAFCIGMRANSDGSSPALTNALTGAGGGNESTPLTCTGCLGLTVAADATVARVVAGTNGSFLCPACHVLLGVNFGRGTSNASGTAAWESMGLGWLIGSKNIACREKHQLQKQQGKSSQSPSTVAASDTESAETKCPSLHALSALLTDASALPVTEMDAVECVEVYSKARRDWHLRVQTLLTQMPESLTISTNGGGIEGANMAFMSLCVQAQARREGAAAWLRRCCGLVQEAQALQIRPATAGATLTTEVVDEETETRKPKKMKVSSFFSKTKPNAAGTGSASDSGELLSELQSRLIRMLTPTSGSGLQHDAHTAPWNASFPPASANAAATAVFVAAVATFRKAVQKVERETGVTAAADAAVAPKPIGVAGEAMS